MDSTITLEIWSRASACCGDEFVHVLNGLLDEYERKPGKDEPVRITAECIGQVGYSSLVVALNAKSRRNVRYYSHDWHIELRSRLWAHICRGIQQRLVLSGLAPEPIIEDFLAFEIGA
ncbi:hypothetical protein RPPX_22020 [Pseudomonas putida S12]|uniref:Uncharacterized protein n=1 Tax=Pseudomonas putida S12 TaxID=1215087 RepID=A0AA34RYJ4_PSEPU|nr:hypothetical protein [Pseudomonas putida]AJA15899.1 hypothetical protein RPPX_22020 [Pseudomonas putida S12]